MRKDTDYALAAIVCLAKNASEGRLSATELASRLDIPHGFLRKILQVLGHRGIISSSSGKGGGFELTSDPCKLSVYSVLEAVQGPIRGTDCAVNKHVCPNTHGCHVRDVMKHAEVKLKTELEAVTITDLMNK